MNIERVYPPAERRKLTRRDILLIARWPFLFAAYICPILNVITGGRAWSVIVLWSLLMCWSLVFSTDLIEYNRIRQFIKLVTYSAILLILIDVLITPGWAQEVVSIVCFSGLIVGGILLFTDLEKQKHNISPMLLLSAISFLSSIAGIIVWRENTSWALIVMGALSLALLVACFMVLGQELTQEMRKHFHTK